jgi:hypothetical protein
MASLQDLIDPDWLAWVLTSLLVGSFAAALLASETLPDPRRAAAIGADAAPLHGALQHPGWWPAWQMAEAGNQKLMASIPPDRTTQ